jgi:hypothetical protein
MIVLSNIFLMASLHNYPGGVAIDRLIRQHIGLQLAISENEDHLITRPIFVHIDTLAATSGVTR